MKVADLLKNKGQNVISIAADKSVAEALKTLMENKISSLVVLDANHRLIGIITERDIFRAATMDYEGIHSKKVADLMSTNLIVGTLEDDIEYVKGIMTQNRIRHLPIVAQEGLVGMVSIGDIVKFQLHETIVKNRYLEDMVFGKMPTNSR
jgi:CBS domain-containing protein